MSDLLNHHATVFVGTTNYAVLELLNGLDLLGISEKGNPDFFHEKFEVLTVDDSRRIREIHESRPFSDAKPRVFIMEIHGATREAQNALLKMIEEPLANNFFYIIVPLADILLPTVRSRVRVINIKNSVKEKGGAMGFFQMSLSEKIAYVDDLALRISDEKATKFDAIVFLNEIEAELRAHFFTVDSLKKFEVIARARDYLNDRAPSVKMLLEYVALSL